MDLIPYMERWQMMPPPDGVILCAVSGGKDSVCLLHYLHSVAPQWGFTVAAGHLNHVMRREAERDVAFVCSFCRERGIPFYTKAVPVYEMAELWHVGVEEAGRRARYEFLQETAQRIGADRIATAHHQNDQAETVLLNLLRGTGPEGLGGIPPVRGNYIRPLLQTSRSEIEAYLAEHGLDHVEDATNQDTGYARNRLRLTIWPQLTAINGAATEHIAAAAELVRCEDDYLNQLARERLPHTGTAISREELEQAPKVLQNRMIRLLLERLPSGKKDVSGGHIEAILALAEGDLLDLPGKMRVTCRQGVLTIAIRVEAPAEMALHLGIQRWGEYTVTVDERQGDVPVPAEALTVRSWRSDDRLTLPGSRGSRSLKRLFNDAAIPAEMREQVPVICCAGRAVFVFGVGVDAESMDEQNKKTYITIRKENEEEPQHGKE